MDVAVNVLTVIGLTGNSGSGKGYVCDLLAKKGIKSIDTDRIVHELYKGTNDCTMKLREIFGDGVFKPNGEVDRQRLGQLVFADRNALDRLNKIVHFYVERAVCDIIDSYRSSGEQIAVIDAPMLFESGLDKKCDVTVAVIASRDTLIGRIMSRDKITCDCAIARLANQHDADFFRKNCDFVIINDKNTDIRTSVDRLVSEITAENEKT